MSLLSEVYKDVSDLNQNITSRMPTEEKVPVVAPQYSATVPMGPPQPAVKTTDRTNNEKVTSESVHPSFDMSQTELNQIQKKFLWVMKQSDEIERKYENDLSQVLNNPEIMKIVIDQFEKYMNEQSHRIESEQHQQQQTPHHNELSDVSIEEIDNPPSQSPWVILFNEIKTPVIMTIIYFLLGTKQVQLYLNNLLPILNEFYTFKLLLSSLLFLVLGILSNKFISWLE